jgi:class 3 adenylate cyclase
VTFAARIALAIAGVVLVAMAVVAVAGGTRVRQTYLDALRGSLEARIDAVEQAQADRTARAREEVERLVRSPRLVATVLAGDGPDLLQTAADELRGALERAGEGAGFVFFSDSAELARSPGIGDDAVRASAESARAVIVAGEPSRVTLAVAGGVPVQLLVASIVDRAEDTVVGALALCSPVRFPAPLTLPDGTVLEAGLALDGTLFGTTLADAARADVAGALGRGQPQVEVSAGDAPGLAVQRPIAAGGGALVVLAGLGPMQASERRLLLTGAVATAVALAVGLASAVVLGRGLSRPVAAIGAAAERIESGDFAVRVADAGQDELARLGRRFNAMAEGLEQREKYRRVLDAVADPDVAAELMAGKLDLGGAEQDVGILFCDIRGFTALTEGKDPHAVISMLNEHMTLLTDVAYAHGGTVDKFVGDLIMVTFGAPKPGGDDAARMARCALAMVEARTRANEGAREPIRIGIGCAYGKVVAGCMGSARRLDYTVLGERVNLASRLCSKAPAMRVWVDAGTRGAVGTLARFGPLPPVEAKGFSRPVEAFDLLAMEVHPR